MLSLSMIVRNEAERLGRCLESVAGFADELVVVDTGSSDDTVAVAEDHGARVEHIDVAVRVEHLDALQDASAGLATPPCLHGIYSWMGNAPNAQAVDAVEHCGRSIFARRSRGFGAAPSSPSARPAWHRWPKISPADVRCARPGQC